MRLTLIVAAFLLMGAAPDITGQWLTQDGAGVVAIAACGSALCGRLVGFRDQPPPKDYRGVSECGLEIIHPTTPGTDGAWHGLITDPSQGTVYRADLAMSPDGKLHLRGYLVIPLLGQTQVWTRYTGRLGPGCTLD